MMASLHGFQIPTCCLNPYNDVNRIEQHGTVETKSVWFGLILRCRIRVWEWIRVPFHPLRVPPGTPNPPGCTNCNSVFQKNHPFPIQNSLSNSSHKIAGELHRDDPRTCGSAICCFFWKTELQSVHPGGFGGTRRHPDPLPNSNLVFGGEPGSTAKLKSDIGGGTRIHCQTQI